MGKEILKFGNSEIEKKNLATIIVIFCKKVLEL